MLHEGTFLLLVKVKVREKVKFSLSKPLDILAQQRYSSTH